MWNARSFSIDRPVIKRDQDDGSLNPAASRLITFRITHKSTGCDRSVNTSVDFHSDRSIGQHKCRPSYPQRSISVSLYVV
ncbi:hypothetical protein F2Q69_00024162 [Brassica cretica]|uniref:Uncharacterized protein n=1 Tax=Brassica cretica TaxID=69181 RepID=A0A8S9QJN3_BRACR|nr:hypothetical protein F2Q69_00024162 [Brassica cretica]